MDGRLGPDTRFLRLDARVTTQLLRSSVEEAPEVRLSGSAATLTVLQARSSAPRSGPSPAGAWPHSHGRSSASAWPDHAPAAPRPHAHRNPRRATSTQSNAGSDAGRSAAPAP